MEKDFQVAQSNELAKDDSVYDLHNQYDFAALVIGWDRIIRLSFDANPEYGKDKRTIVLEFEDVDYLELSSNFGALEIRDLEEMGYKSPGDRDDQWLLDEQQATSTDHLFFRFNDEQFVRVHSQRVRLRKRSAISLVKRKIKEKNKGAIS